MLISASLISVLSFVVAIYTVLQLSKDQPLTFSLKKIAQKLQNIEFKLVKKLSQCLSIYQFSWNLIFKPLRQEA
jgi:hypothetical protein